eukprot:scaffold13071_cov61-Phaeocystis_antarctica.AAC.3
MTGEAVLMALTMLMLGPPFLSTRRKMTSSCITTIVARPQKTMNTSFHTSRSCSQRAAHEPPASSRRPVGRGSLSRPHAVM